MPFNSFQFLLFFPAAALLFYLTPVKYRIKTLLLLSCIFYVSFRPIYILLIFFIISVDYYTAVKIGKSNNAKTKKIFFLAGLLLNISVLLFFKYSAFFTINLNNLFTAANTGFSVHIIKFILPLGISFYIFKSISYLIEVYRGNIEAERTYSSLAAYILFFPELLAGPIDRPHTLLPQFQHMDYDLTYNNLKQGIKYFGWGLFLKTVISDRLAILVDKIYTSPSDYSGIHLITATVFFAFQIYTDFAGYSYIAIGAGRIMGFNMMQNFNHPYLSESVSEFWSRWHISLSTWLRDYLFLPISYWAARKLQIIKIKKNLKFRLDIPSYITGISITMFIGGFWHGDGWNYIAWGLIIAFYLSCSVITSKIRKRIKRKTWVGKFTLLPYFRMVFIFGLMCIAWIFFRASNIGEAWYILTHLLSGLGSISTSGTYFQTEWSQSRIGLNSLDFFGSIFLILTLMAVEFLQLKNKFTLLILIKPRIIKAALFVLFLFIILLLGNFSSDQFIYFQF